MQKGGAFTWSPSAGTSPEPSRRSRAFTPSEPGISANLGAAAEAAAAGRAEAAEARRRYLLVAVRSGVGARVTAFVLWGGSGTAPAAAATAVMTMNAVICVKFFYFSSFFSLLLDLTRFPPSLFSFPFLKSSFFIYFLKEKKIKEIADIFFL